MQFNERDKDFVFQVSSSKLFKRCKKENVPFHHWFRWIENQLREIDQKENPIHQVEEAQVYNKK